jgi:hypothetical protein
MIYIISIIPTIFAKILGWLPESWDWPATFTDGLVSFFSTLYQYDILNVMPDIALIVHFFFWFMLLIIPMYLLLKWMGFIRGTDKLI